MQKGFRLEKTQSIEDTLVLDIIEKLTEGIGGHFSMKAQRLLSKMKNEDFNPIYAKLNIEDISDKFSDIALIEEAIKEKKELRCLYDTERHKHYFTTIKPLKIVNFEGFWYLLALRKEKLKKYYLKNLSAPQKLEKRFEVKEELDVLLNNAISIWFQEDVKPFDVTLLANKTSAKFFKRRPFPTQTIHHMYEDGSMEFTVSITHEMEILPILKYWIPHLKVIEPLTLKEKLFQELKLYMQEIE